MEKNIYPRVKVMCIFNKNGKTLAARSDDRSFYRVLGGSLEMGESVEEGMRREIQEELVSGIENLRFIKIIENKFVYQCLQGHEIVFVYSGDLIRRELYEAQEFEVIDNPGVADSYGFIAEWISIEDVLSGKKILYPSGIQDCF
jgi:ADP-ribose pyrophosphatase YjhB (NUDIX family)